MPGSADAGNGIGGTADKVKVLASCAIATSSITSSHIVDGTIVDGDINGSAAIALSKLASCPLARSGHTGTQTASTISDFDTEVANNTAVAANTAKTGISSGQASAITANTAKISYCSTASTKLATIASCANNYTHSTNANLTGPITSVGNATAIASGAIAAAKITGPLTNVASHGLAASATTDATCAANIGSGTLPLARLSSITKAQITNTERLENLIFVK